MYNITIYRNKTEWKYIITVNKKFLPEGKNTDEYIFNQFKKIVPVIESESIYGVNILEIKPHTRYRLSLEGRYSILKLVEQLDSNIDNIILPLEDNDDIEVWEIDS